MQLEPLKIAWSVQVLTLDYLMDGSMDGGRNKNNLRLVDRVVLDLPLANVSFQPAGNLTAVPRAGAAWTMVFADSLVAIIPRDAASLAAAMQNNAFFNKSFLGEVYVGPYVLRGTVLTSDNSVQVMPMYPAFPMQAVTIDCLLPGSKVAGVTAPYALVLSRHKQLVVPLE